MFQAYSLKINVFLYFSKAVVTFIVWDVHDVHWDR